MHRLNHFPTILTENGFNGFPVFQCEISEEIQDSYFLMVTSFVLFNDNPSQVP